MNNELEIPVILVGAEEALEKAHELVRLLEQANQLADNLADRAIQKLEDTCTVQVPCKYHAKIVLVLK